jgi:hypothetical protein
MNEYCKGSLAPIPEEKAVAMQRQQDKANKQLPFLGNS